MPCYRPLKGYRSASVSPKSGKRAIVFNAREGLNDMPVDLPCGQCVGCRLEHSRQWAVRCAHEAQLHERNCFVTLTYRDECLPKFGSLDYDAPVQWMKRLRAKIEREHVGDGPVPSVRSFGCAEYGEKFRRPHYHVVLFGWDFEDREPIGRSGEHTLYRSDFLSETWKFGYSSVADFSFDVAAYVARYVTKKVTGDRADEHYFGFDPDTGECFQRAPERAVCVSRRPGLGRPWYEKFGQHSRDHDFVVLRGVKMRPPKYYDRLFDVADPAGFAKKRALRKRSGLCISLREAASHPVGFDRLSVKERCHELKFKQLKRGLENG